jgi:hypothetical protein
VARVALPRESANLDMDPNIIGGVCRGGWRHGSIPAPVAALLDCRAELTLHLAGAGGSDGLPCRLPLTLVVESSWRWYWWFWPFAWRPQTVSDTLAHARCILRQPPPVQLSLVRWLRCLLVLALSAQSVRDAGHRPVVLFCHASP